MRQHALFIGIDDYAFAPLTSCVNDAIGTKDLMVSLGMLADGDWTLMTSPATRASPVPTRKAILQFLLDFYESGDPLDRMVVFYAGHGLAVRLGRGADELHTVLVPAGVQQIKNSGDELIDLDELIGRFNRRGAREQYWVVDSCRNRLEGPVPNVAGIGWDVPNVGDPRDAYEMAQGVLYAVGMLGEARSERGGHGLLTSHLLDALACRGAAEWGGSGWYDDALDAWLIDLDSLKEYARRQIEPTLSAKWQADYLLPQCWNGEKKPGPLTAIRSIKKRPFAVLVTPPQASGELVVSLKLRRHTVAEWPPHGNGAAVDLTPDRYRLEAALTPSARQWLPPQIPNPPVVDVRYVDRFDVTLEPNVPPSPAAVPNLGKAPDIPPPSVSARYVSPSDTASLLEQLSAIDLPVRGASAPRPPVIMVKAIDPGVTLHLSRLTGGKQDREGLPNAPIVLSEGLWRIEIRIGTDVIGMLEENFVAEQYYVIEASAQVTPALAALLPDPWVEADTAASKPKTTLVPSETIGPMQGAILPTLLPLLALKPLDHAKLLLRGLPQLDIPLREQQTPYPLLIGLAFDGAWTDADARNLSGMVKIDAGPPALTMWHDDSHRVSLSVIDEPQRKELAELRIPEWGAMTAVVPRVPNYATTLTLIVWPDGRRDIAVSMFVLPAGSDEVVRPARLSRAMALAARLYRGGRSLDDVQYDVFTTVSSGSYGNPVLGAIAWFARERRLGSDTQSAPEMRDDLRHRQNAIRSFLTRVVPQLGDTRVITALSGPESEASLDALLADPAMTQPVLAEPLSILARHAIARKQLGHWSVSRFQQLATDAVFNVSFHPSSL